MVFNGTTLRHILAALFYFSLSSLFSRHACWLVGKASWAFGLLDCWIAGLLDCWIAGLLDCWIAGLLDY